MELKKVKQNLEVGNLYTWMPVLTDSLWERSQIAMAAIISVQKMDSCCVFFVETKSFRAEYFWGFRLARSRKVLYNACQTKGKKQPKIDFCYFVMLAFLGKLL